ncbi:hypothetical protein BGX27_002813 [Mortierella sp. AM989]|nr:hypothetical protein BGX27_002813 [Mortierella sp. AM989]
MGEYQGFRVAGTTAVTYFDVDNVDGQNIIFWEDIERVFPRVQHVQNGKFVVKLLRNLNRARITPHCIKHCPGIVLDVVLSTAAEHAPIDSLLRPPNLTPDLVITGVAMLLRKPQWSGSEGSKSAEDSAAIASPETDSKKATMVSGFEGTVIRKLDVLYDQSNKVMGLTKQMNDRLVLIQNKTEAILTQNYELLEYAIPRLFIVLPEASTTWDPASAIRTKFRLHFICECGEHTKATGSRIPHHLHLANHEGYVVNKPTDFFRKYGSFLILMLEMIKLGTRIAGHVVPALEDLKVVNSLSYSQSTINSVTSEIIKGVDYSLAYLEKNLALIPNSDGVDVGGDARSLQHDLASYLADVEGLEGVDLRQLGSYLAFNSSDDLLGNLYRMTTKDGHVKWVCRDHYRAGYQEVHTRRLHEVVKLAGGNFDEQRGRVEIDLKSNFAAAELYDAISKAKGVLDLDVSLSWNFVRADSVKLKSIISVSNIKSVTVRLPLAGYFTVVDTLVKTPLKNIMTVTKELSSTYAFESPFKILKDTFVTTPLKSLKIASDQISNNYKLGSNIASSPYGPIFEIMQLPTIQSFEVDHIPKNYLSKTSPLSKKADLSNLRHLGVHRVNSDTDIANLKLLVSQAPNLSSLSLQTTLERLPAVFSSIAGHQIYPIDFRNYSLRILPSKRESSPSMAAFQGLTHLFTVHSAQLES